MKVRSTSIGSNGGVLVAVNTDTQLTEEAVSIMQRHTDAETSERVTRLEGVTTAEEERAQRKAPAQVVSAVLSQSRRDLEAELKEEATIPVVQEELHVGKRKIQRGPVRVFKHVTERPLDESIQLRDENVTVERRIVNRLASDARISKALRIRR